jgi:hypothetical protein
MNNRFRDPAAEPVLADVPELEPPAKAEPLKGFWGGLFSEGVIAQETAVRMLPFIIFVAMLGMVYIANRHFAEKTVREIDKLNKEVKELSWDYKTLKADLMQKSTQTEVALLVDTLGLKEPVEPPKKIAVEVAADEAN